MYECPNCGGDLRFDIASQKLKCNHCESSFDPYEQEKQADAVESTDDEYQVTVFTCPECGAEIESTNLSAAGFCSYCGGAVVFSSRVQKEKRPAKIIPFRVTKEDCRKSYLSMIKRTPYTPKELKDPKYLERFVGFYLPYWSFRSKTEREVHVDGVKRTRRGDYIYVDHYHLSGKLDASYDGVSYDASSSFDDGISQRIAPFSTKNMVDFAPSFLLGFYADTADVPVEIYQNEAYTTIAKDIVRRLLSSQGFQKGGIKVESSATAQIRNEIAGDISSERMMFPIWFLTYRKGDRIAYSVVNGSTGTIYSDLPIDSGRFFRASLLFAIPIFLLLNLILSLSAQKILIFSMLLAVFTIFLYAMEIRAIHRKEKRKDDTGYQWKQKDEAKSAAAEPEDMQGKNMTEEYQRRSQAKNTERVPAKNTHFTEMLGAVFAVLLSALILFWNPVEDLFFYLGSVVSLLSIGITILGVIKKYNNFATRPVPDFFTKKGE